MNEIKLNETAEKLEAIREQLVDIEIMMTKLPKISDDIDVAKDFVFVAKKDVKVSIRLIRKELNK